MKINYREKREDITQNTHTAASPAEKGSHRRLRPLMSSQSFCFPLFHDPRAASNQPASLGKLFSPPQTSLFMFLMIVDNMKHISLPSSRLSLFFSVHKCYSHRSRLFKVKKQERCSNIYCIIGRCRRGERMKKGQSRALCFTRTSESSESRLERKSSSL
jgi:hypothetical protein